jgi:hypothetical protein
VAEELRVGWLVAMQMSSEASKVAVPESVLRKRKREEQWAAEKKEKAIQQIDAVRCESNVPIATTQNPSSAPAILSFR